MMAEEPVDRPSSTTVFYLLIGLLYLFPLAQDLAVRIPSERFRLWPLTLPQRAAIQTINLAVNPLLLIAIFFAALTRDRALGRALFAAGAIAPFLWIGGSFLLRRTKVFTNFRPLQSVPRFPALWVA